MAQENNRLIDRNTHLAKRFKELTKKYTELKQNYNSLNDDHHDEVTRTQEENAKLRSEVARLVKLLALSGKKDRGELSAEMEDTIKRLVREKTWWGTKFIESEEDLIEETTIIADYLDFSCNVEKANWIQKYDQTVLLCFNKERQYANAGFFTAAKSKFCVFLEKLRD
jgi:hypothetical protein